MSTVVNRPKKGPKFRTDPKNPKQLLRIIRLRDVENKRWRQIGKEMGMTHQGPYTLYKRWREWAYEKEAS